MLQKVDAIIECFVALIACATTVTYVLVAKKGISVHLVDHENMLKQDKFNECQGIRAWD